MYHMKNDKAGVSPVIATLILVLIAVAAGVAFYAWQSGWQEDSTANISDANVKSKITIGGSTTVLPFTEVAAEKFMAENPTIEISFQAGGSGAGIGAVRAGAIDIGSASKAVTDSPADEVVVQVGTDAVVLIVSDARYALLDAAGQNMLRTEVQDIYDGTTLNWDSFTTVDNGDLIVTYDRSDESGTEECFVEKILGGKGQLDTEGSADESVPSNQEMVVEIAADNLGLGFASFGVADLASGISLLQYEGVAPTTTTIKTEIADPAAAGYSAIRPLNYIYYPGNPLIEQYIQFCLGPEMNIEICAEADYFAMY